MSGPGIGDAIVAISSAWQASPRGIVRATGPDLASLLDALGITPPSSDHPRHQRVRLTLHDVCLPAEVFHFPPGRSYTGQQLVEIHTSGSTAWLRAVAGALLAAGARRAEPGEFTARAYLNGRLGADQAEGVLALIHAADATSARQAARACLGQAGRGWDELGQELIALLGAIEAGIDFVDEEDVRFIDRSALRTRIVAVLARVRDLRETGTAGRVARPHVALLGPPNAGKSTLFNALLGHQRAIVSPVIGTTRDVLSADLSLDGRWIVLQDSAGLGPAADELDRAAQEVSRGMGAQADLIVWVEDGRQSPGAVPGDLPAVPIVRVRTHVDAGDFRPGSGLAVSGPCGTGLTGLREALKAALDRAGGGASGPLAREVGVVVGHLERARELLAGGTSENLDDPELLAVELRGAWERLQGLGAGDATERTLDWIYGAFCLGK